MVDQPRVTDDASLGALLRISRQEEREAAQAQQLDERAAFLLPLMMTLDRLAARRTVGEEVQL